MIDQPYVTVIIPTYKDTDFVLRCMDALSKQTYPKDNFEVLIINNAPQDKINFASRFKNLNIIDEFKPGSYAARNKGLSYANGSIIAFTDSDCVPSQDWILNAIKIFETTPKIERLTGPVRIFREPYSSWLAWKFESITAFNQRFNVQKGVSVTANLFVKREIFNTVGYFDANLFSGGDIEWNERATRAGFGLLFSEDVIVNHPARKTFRDIIKKSKRVVGGEYLRAKRDRKLFHFIIRYFMPPINYVRLLIRDQKPFLDIVFAGLVYWIIKIYLLKEISRLFFGGKPLR